MEPSRWFSGKSLVIKLKLDIIWRKTLGVTIAAIKEKLFFKHIDKTKKNIWRYAGLYSPFIKEESRLTLDEAGMRCQIFSELNAELSSRYERCIKFKREDENPTGSHKARALAYQVSYYKANGHKTLIISSSGNAAIAAAAYSSLSGIRLISFIHKDTQKVKVNEIMKTGQPVVFCTKPINFANYAARIFDIPNIRPSHDDLSIEPYKSIAFELFEEFGESIDAVFMFPTSASSLIGTARGFLQLRDDFGAMKRLPKIIAVQTGAITSIAEHFEKGRKPWFGKESSLKQKATAAGALGVRVTKRTDEAVDLLIELDGSGIIVNSDEISKADKMLKRYGIVTSKEGAAALAGAIRFRNLKNVVCILTGREYEESVKEVKGSVLYAESYTGVREIVGKLIA